MYPGWYVIPYMYNMSSRTKYVCYYLIIGAGLVSLSFVELFLKFLQRDFKYFEACAGIINLWLKILWFSRKSNNLEPKIIYMISSNRSFVSMLHIVGDPSFQVVAIGNQWFLYYISCNSLNYYCKLARRYATTKGT